MGRQSYALNPDRILWILAIIAGGRNTATLPTGPWHGYLGHVHAYTDGVRFITSLYHGVMHYTTAHLRNPVREAPFRLIYIYMFMLMLFVGRSLFVSFWCLTPLPPPSPLPRVFFWIRSAVEVSELIHVRRRSTANSLRRQAESWRCVIK